MKKIAYLICLILFVETVDAQVAGRCLVCPPSLSGVPDGWCLKDSSGYAVWGPCAHTADSVLWHSGNGNLYPANSSLNVGIGTDNPMGKLTVVNDAQNVVFGSLYSTLIMDNVWGTDMTDSCHKYGLVMQNPSAPNDHLMVFYSTDTCNGEGVNMMINHDVLDQEMGIIMNYDNADSNKASIFTFNSNGVRCLKNNVARTLNFQITPTGQMVYTKDAAAGYVLTSDASGNATWQTLSGAIGTGIPAYANNAAAFAAIGAGKLYYTDVAGEYVLKLSH